MTSGNIPFESQLHCRMSLGVEGAGLMQGSRETPARMVARQREEVVGCSMHFGGKTHETGRDWCGEEGVRQSCLLRTIFALLRCSGALTALLRETLSRPFCKLGNCFFFFKTFFF